MIHSINHVTKRRTPSLDEDSVMVSKVGQGVCWKVFCPGILNLIYARYLSYLFVISCLKVNHLHKRVKEGHPVLKFDVFLEAEFCVVQIFVCAFFVLNSFNIVLWPGIIQWEPWGCPFNMSLCFCCFFFYLEEVIKILSLQLYSLVRHLRRKLRCFVAIFWLIQLELLWVNLVR